MYDFCVLLVKSRLLIQFHSLIFFKEEAIISLKYNSVINTTIF